MAGFGNRTAPDYVAEDMTDQHASTRLGLTDSHGAYSNAHPKYGSGATGGAGFGNKSDAPTTHTSNDEFRFDKHKNTSAYSGADESRAGSGSTAGAGFGNKTGSFGNSGDSTLGKVMEKAGHMMKNENMVAKGAAKREEKRVGEETGPFAN
ncbi:hypothetical protein CC86DRAFT_412978 [Ophiobolus disseminans]|uniref:Uncharacterized protein n=1 Tax=Ophiobolus disseminans TaxID=1469910 RepID=A0A6A6ZE23_9PLEO|nr:hypothetical protein CC86DRAFT_412978 [Ophiobolus disseminans]